MPFSEQHCSLCEYLHLQRSQYWTNDWYYEQATSVRRDYHLEWELRGLRHGLHRCWSSLEVGCKTAKNLVEGGHTWDTLLVATTEVGGPVADGTGIDYGVEEAEVCCFDASRAFFFTTRGSPFWVTHWLTVRLRPVERMLEESEVENDISKDVGWMDWMSYGWRALCSACKFKASGLILYSGYDSHQWLKHGHWCCRPAFP